MLSDDDLAEEEDMRDEEEAVPKELGALKKLPSLPLPFEENGISSLVEEETDSFPSSLTEHEESMSAVNAMFRNDLVFLMINENCRLLLTSPQPHFNSRFWKLCRFIKGAGFAVPFCFFARKNGTCKGRVPFRYTFLKGR